MKKRSPTERVTALEKAIAKTPEKMRNTTTFIVAHFVIK